MAINSVTLGGNATRDAEVRMTKSGNYAVGIGIAVNEWKDGADYTNFFDVTMFVKVDNERQKSYIASVRKGDKIVVQGHLRYSTWEKDGSKRSKVEVQYFLSLPSAILMNSLHCFFTYLGTSSALQFLAYKYALFLVII